MKIYFKKMKKNHQNFGLNLVILPEFSAFCPNFFKTGGAAAPPAPLADTPMTISIKYTVFFQISKLESFRNSHTECPGKLFSPFNCS